MINSNSAVATYEGYYIWEGCCARCFIYGRVWVARQGLGVILFCSVSHIRFCLS